MLGRGIAEQHRLALALQQRLRDGARALARRLDLLRRLDALLRRNGASDPGQRRDPTARRHGEVRGDRHQPVVVRRVEPRHLRAVPCRRAQAQREEGMVLAQEGADDERALEAGQRLDRHPEPARPARLEVGEVGMAQAMIDVLAAEPAHQPAEQMQLLDRALRRGERADSLRAVVGSDLLQTARHVVEGARPIDRLPLVALPDHRCGETLVAVQRLVAEAVAVGDPAFVDGLVLERQHAHHAVALDLHDEVGAGGIVRAHALAPRQLPGACAVAKRLAGQRPDRAQVDHVARQLGVDRVAGERW